MIDNWWQFAEGMGLLGSDLSLYSIKCPFCKVQGNFNLQHRSEMKNADESKVLYFDTYKCINCAGFNLIFWSNNGEDHHGLHNYKQVPYLLDVNTPPDYWPPLVSKHWVQSHKSMQTESWDAAVVMSRSALQAAIQDKGGNGRDLYNKIEDLFQRGQLPPIMKDWATEIRLLGKISAHPEEDQREVTEEDAQDIVEFMDYFLEYMYDLPKQIQTYRSRKSKNIK